MLDFSLPQTGRWKKLYLLDSGLAVVACCGFAFFAGLETPMLIRKNPKPLRSEESKLIDSVPFQTLIADGLYAIGW